METGFLATQTVVRLANLAHRNTDPSLIAERQEGASSTLLFYHSEDTEMGVLEEWDGKFFSFVHPNMVDPNPEDNVIKIYNMSGQESIPSPEGTFMRMDFILGGIAAEGETTDRRVAFLNEGLPLVQDLIRDTGAFNVRRVNPWRTMTETEGSNLQVDASILLGRLTDHIAQNGGVLFGEDE